MNKVEFNDDQTGLIGCAVTILCLAAAIVALGILFRAIEWAF